MRKGAAVLGDRLGESAGKFTGVRVLPSEGGQIKIEVSFQGRGTLLGQEIIDTGTYWQTVRPGGVLYGEGHVLFMTSAGDVVDWVGQVKGLSMAVQQEIEIAKAITRKPRYIIFDEPSASLGGALLLGARPTVKTTNSTTGSVIAEKVLARLAPSCA